MKMLSCVVVLLAIGLPALGQPEQLAGPGTDSLSKITLPPELDRILRDYEEGWRNEDEVALAALFAPEGFILRPGHPPVRGRANIEQAYENSGGPLFLHAFDYAVADSVGYIIGGYGHSRGGPDNGKYVLTLRLMDDGRWYITADMDNHN